MTAEPVLRVLQSLGAGYALIGGHAVALRGFPRATIDIDFLTTAPQVLDATTWQDLVANGSLVECRRGGADDPLAGVTSIELGDGTVVDVILARWKWEGEVIERAEMLPFGPTRVPVPLTSDLILLKLAAGGSLDLRDAAALLAINDRQALIREVESRVPEVRPDITAAWNEVLAIEL